MKQRYRRAISILLTVCILFALPVLQAAAGYETGYVGGGSGDGNGIYAYGVDLSSWQGDGVDFQKIKAQGIDFVILRAGFATTEDSNFEENYTRAKAAGLDVGVYLYSYADTPEGAAAEAAALKIWLAGKVLEYPVYYDIEDLNAHVPMTSSALTEMILTFLDSMAADGWLTGVYSSLGWLQNKLETDTICRKYECWMALYYDNTYDIYDRYDELYGMWQYSASGNMDGVPDTVDMNICFKDYPTICRQYGFNGYSATGETLLLNGAAAPTVIARGDSFPVNGRVTSTEGSLLNVTVGIYNKAGELLTGRTAAPQSASYDLAGLASGVKMQELAEGSYEYRVIARNGSGTQTLMKQSLVISSSGARLDEASIPQDAKEGELFAPEGTVSASTNIRSVEIRVCTESGTEQRSASAAPNAPQFDLTALASALRMETLPVGRYEYQIWVQTEKGRQELLAVPFIRWVRDDPITLAGFSMRSVYQLGELTDLSGVITSEKSVLQTVSVTLYSRNGEVVASAESSRQKRQVVLSEFRQTLHLDTLPAGAYILRITALNAGGPVTLAEQTFLVRADAISLCEFEAPTVLTAGDTFLLEGMVASDVSPLTFIGVTVKDEANQLVLDAAAAPLDNRFDLSELNRRLLFSTLPVGEYALCITAKNGQGYETLYQESFTVTESRDKVVWEDGHYAFYGMAYYSGETISLWGDLVSETSDLQSVTAEISNDGGTIIESASLLVNGRRASIQPLNEMLKFSALPAGNYQIKFVATNASGAYTVLAQSFSVTDCQHRNVTTGTVYPASCDRYGVVCDSRCLNCGAKVRGGRILPPEPHDYQEGVCRNCGKAEYLTVSAHSAETVENNGRYVFAAEQDGRWYALGMNAEAVEIAAPDAEGNITVSADLLWTPTVTDRETMTFFLSNSHGARLHLDSGALSVGRGAENTLLTAAPHHGVVRLTREPTHCVIFDGKGFGVGNEGCDLYLFSYTNS